jgi:photosystem II stability/assembly factor-like uncharacterized protein
MNYKIYLLIGFLTFILAVSIICNNKSSSQNLVTNTNSLISLNTETKNQNVSGQEPEFDQIYFFDQKVGWAITQNNLVFTQNGGERWETKYLSEEAKSLPLKNFKFQERIRNFQFLSAKEGWLLKENKLLYTKNGGDNWNELNSPNLVVQSFCFLNNQVGWIVGDEKIHGDSEWESRLYSTVNGGRNWKKIKLNISVPYEGSFLNVFASTDKGLWVIGNFIYHSKDFGKTWEKLKFEGELYGTLTDIKFGQSNYGYISTNQGSYFLLTMDGGKSWRSKIFPTSRDGIMRLALNDEGMLWAIGKDGIYQSKVNEDDWKKINEGLYSSIEFIPNENVLITAGKDVSFENF